MQKKSLDAFQINFLFFMCTYKYLINHNQRIFEYLHSICIDDLIVVQIKMRKKYLPELKNFHIFYK